MTQPFDLKQLADVRGLCLTIMEPLEEGLPQVSGPEARILRAVEGADRLLKNRGYDEASRAEFLRPVVKIARNTNWSGNKGSIVIFRAPGFTNAGFWPDPLDATARLADEFFILPLLQAPQPSFWLLALSIKHVRLFHGNRRALTEVPLPVGTPETLGEFEGFDTPDRDLESRSASGPSNGNMHAVRFGTVSVHERRNRHLRDFFRQLDQAVRHLVPEGEPLIVAAVERELAIYRAVNTCPSLNKRAIAGSPDGFTAARLHGRALEILSAVISESSARLRMEIDRAADKGLLLTDAEPMLDAARTGRVGRLFIDSELLQSDPLQADLINSAALSVIRNSGTAVCGNRILNTPHSAAARLRYRMPAPDLNPSWTQASEFSVRKAG